QVQEGNIGKPWNSWRNHFQKLKLLVLLSYLLNKQLAVTAIFKSPDDGGSSSLLEGNILPRRSWRAPCPPRPVSRAPSHHPTPCPRTWSQSQRLRSSPGRGGE
ncbi:hypothetical protein LEMLEM_LOCUS20048, partial [Lemmus lemmus]